MIGRTFQRLVLAVAAAGLFVASPAAAEPMTDALAAMRMLDQQVATIGHRLATANRALCTDRRWLAGLALHELSQYDGAYRDAAIRAFSLGAHPGVLAVVPGGPAERAGLRQDDAVLSLDGAPLSAPRELDGRGSFERMEQILDDVERAFADGAARVEVDRSGERRAIEVVAEPGCPTRFQLIPSGRLNALADGRYVQVTTAIAAYVADEGELAAVLAHEFAHNVLGHRDRLDAAGVARGFFRNFGRNARMIRQTEIEADRLSIHLLDRAGFDPEAAIRFWSRFGRRGLNLLGSATHPDWRRRIETFRAEIAVIAAARAAGSVPVVPLVAGPAASPTSR